LPLMCYTFSLIPCATEPYLSFQITKITMKLQWLLFVFLFIILVTDVFGDKTVSIFSHCKQKSDL